MFHSSDVETLPQMDPHIHNKKANNQALTIAAEQPSAPFVSSVAPAMPITETPQTSPLQDLFGDAHSQVVSTSTQTTHDLAVKSPNGNEFEFGGNDNANSKMSENMDASSRRSQRLSVLQGALNSSHEAIFRTVDRFNENINNSLFAVKSEVILILFDTSSEEEDLSSNRPIESIITHSEPDSSMTGTFEVNSISRVQ